MTTHSQHAVPSYYMYNLAHHLHPQAYTSPGIKTNTHALTNHTLHRIHVLLPPSLKPYKFTPCISTWPACSNAYNILLTDHCHSPHISQGYTSPTRHCTLSCWLAWAPPSSSILMHSTCPSLDAHIRELHPSCKRK